MMSRTTTTWIIIGASLILVGCVIIGCILAIPDWNLLELSTEKYKTNEYTINDKYTNISIATDTAGVTIVPSDNTTSSVVCYEHQNAKHSVLVKDQTLTIEITDTRKWYDHIRISFGKPTITVYIPKGEYGFVSIESDTGDVNIAKDFKFENIEITESTGKVTNYACASNGIIIKTSTGDISVENASSKTLDLSVSTGDINVSGFECEDDINISVSTGKTNLNNIKCKNILSDGSTGNITLNNVVAENNFSIKRTTGYVKFESSDASEIFVETDTGNVSGTLLSEKVFFTQTDTGKTDVPKTTNGGKCEIRTSTGNIELEIE